MVYRAVKILSSGFIAVRNRRVRKTDLVVARGEQICEEREEEEVWVEAV